MNPVDAPTEPLSDLLIGHAGASEEPNLLKLSSKRRVDRGIFDRLWYDIGGVAFPLRSVLVPKSGVDPMSTLTDVRRDPVDRHAASV